MSFEPSDRWAIGYGEGDAPMVGWKQCLDAVRKASPRAAQSLSAACFVGFRGIPSPRGAEILLAFPTTANFPRLVVMKQLRRMLEAELSKALHAPAFIVEMVELVKENDSLVLELLNPSSLGIE